MCFFGVSMNNSITVNKERISSVCFIFFLFFFFAVFKQKSLVPFPAKEGQEKVKVKKKEKKIPNESFQLQQSYKRFYPQGWRALC